MNTAPSPLRKPLYLNSEQHSAVQRDGLALRVHRPYKSDRLFPLSRLSRVISWSEVAWSGAAMVACAEQHIPLFFINHHGQLQARLQAPAPQTTLMDIYTLLRSWIEEQGSSAYRLWLQAQIRRAQCRVLGQAINLPQDMAIRPIALLLAQAEKRLEHRALRRFMAFWQSLLIMQVQERLHSMNVHLEQAWWSLQGISLAADLSHILLWQSWREMLALSRKRIRQAQRRQRPKAKLSAHDALHLHHQLTSTLEDALNHTVLALHRHALNAIHQPPDGA